MIYTLYIREEDVDLAYDPEAALREFLRSVGCRPPAIGPVLARPLNEIGIKYISMSNDPIKCIRTIIVDTTDQGPNRASTHSPDEDSHD